MLEKILKYMEKKSTSQLISPLFVSFIIGLVILLIIKEISSPRFENLLTVINFIYICIISMASGIIYLVKKEIPLTPKLFIARGGLAEYFGCLIVIGSGFFIAIAIFAVVILGW